MGVIIGDSATAVAARPQPSRTAPPSPLISEERLLGRQHLAELEDAARYHRRVAHDAEDHASELRLIARRLGQRIEPLRTITDPIRDSHVDETWQGNAAFASRQRLEDREQRCRHAVRRVDELIADLEAEAVVADQLAAAHWRANARTNSAAQALALDIGWFNGHFL